MVFEAICDKLCRLSGEFLTQAEVGVKDHKLKAPCQSIKQRENNIGWYSKFQLAICLIFEILVLFFLF